MAAGVLEFRPPSWYRPRKRWPGKLCLFHDRYCQKLERVLELLHPQPQVDEEEKNKKEEKEKEKEKEREREMKMGEYLGELSREMEAEWKRKQKKKEKKMRRKKKMMTEEEKKEEEEEEQKKMMEEEEERKRMEEEERRRRREEEEEWEQWKQWMKTKNQRPAPVQWTIKEGDKYDIPQLLSSSPSRDYLIKNNGDKVN